MLKDLSRFLRCVRTVFRCRGAKCRKFSQYSCTASAKDGITFPLACRIGLSIVVTANDEVPRIDTVRNRQVAYEKPVHYVSNPTKCGFGIQFLVSLACSFERSSLVSKPDEIVSILGVHSRHNSTVPNKRRCVRSKERPVTHNAIRLQSVSVLGHWILWRKERPDRAWSKNAAIQG